MEFLAHGEGDAGKVAVAAEKALGGVAAGEAAPSRGAAVARARQRVCVLQQHL